MNNYGIKQIFNMFFGYLKRLDKILILLCLAACGFSIVLLYSMVENEISVYVLERHYIMQGGMAILGLFSALVIAGINYKFISKTWYIYGFFSIVLVLLLFTPLGLQAEGSEEINWLNLGFTAIQPSEFLKVAFVVTFSTHLSRVGKRMNQIPHLILICIHAVVPTGLLLVRGDFGTSLVFMLITVTMIFAAGLWWRYIIISLAALPVVIYMVWNFVFKQYHKIRILILIDEEIRASEMLGLYNQQRLSLIAMGSGQLSGKGLFGGEYVYVPAFQTDFIFSYIGMTLGFIGCAATLCLMGLILLRILTSSYTARDMLGKLMCVGVFSMFLYNTVINIGMALAVMPVIGQPLPFISAGGSSVLAFFMAVGLVLSVKSHKEKKYHMFYNEKD